MKEYLQLSPKSRLQLWMFFLRKINQQIGYEQIEFLEKKDLNGREVVKHYGLVLLDIDVIKIKSIVNTVILLVE